MRLTIIQKKLLNKIRGILLKSCHAPGCVQVSKCPNLCSCRTRRTFALNTETAICWEIADRLSGLLGKYNPTKQYIRDIVISIQAYHNISRFHMTKGWENFFYNIYDTIDKITNPDNRPRANIFITYWENIEIDINDLKNNLKRLKRYPK